MPRQPATTRLERPRLNTERVLAGALELADESGIDAVTMRALGKRLGVEAMSLYNHVASKEDVVDGIVDIIIRKIELPDPSLDWQVSVRRTALSAYAVLLGHPWSCGAVMMPRAGGGRTGRLRYIEGLLRTFTEAGFSPELTYRAYHAVDSHILGFTMWEVGHSAAARIAPEVVEQLLAIVSAGEYPHLLTHARQHMTDEPRIEGEFEYGLDLILEGLRRAYEAESSHSSRRPAKKR